MGPRLPVDCDSIGLPPSVSARENKLVLVITTYL